MLLTIYYKVRKTDVRITELNKQGDTLPMDALETLRYGDTLLLEFAIMYQFMYVLLLFTQIKTYLLHVHNCTALQIIFSLSTALGFFFVFRSLSSDDDKGNNKGDNGNSSDSSSDDSNSTIAVRAR
jgi:uncharacterized protein involved in high-affinity Fe2+ transport